MINAYERLGIPIDASEDTIRRAIAKLAGQNKIGLDEAETYQKWLLNPAIRKQYNAKLFAEYPELIQQMVDDKVQRAKEDVEIESHLNNIDILDEPYHHPMPKKEAESTSGKHNATTNKNLKIIIGIIVALVVLFIVLPVIVEIKADYDKASEMARTGNANHATAEKFDTVRNYMSKEELFEVMGGQGELLSSNYIAGISTEARRWEAARGRGGMTVMIQDGRVVSKSQAGLK